MVPCWHDFCNIGQFANVVKSLQPSKNGGVDKVVYAQRRLPTVGKDRQKTGGEPLSGPPRQH